MPDIGLHKIQVFGNNSLGTMYQSSIRYFTISPIQLTTPENITYYGPMNGYYPGTFGFERDENGSDPKDWVVSEVDGTVNVVESKTSHNKVVEFYDTGLDRVGMTNAITRTDGTFI